MKRVQRKIHLLIWIVLAPVLVVLLCVAVAWRATFPGNESLPGAGEQDFISATKP